jgi:hypothetical protein
MISLVRHNNLQFDFAIKELARVAAEFPIIALIPTLSPFFKSIFFYKIVTIPYWMI